MRWRIRRIANAQGHQRLVRAQMAIRGRANKGIEVTALRE